MNELLSEAERKERFHYQYLNTSLSQITKLLNVGGFKKMFSSLFFNLRVALGYLPNLRCDPKRLIKANTSNVHQILLLVFYEIIKAARRLTQPPAC